MKYSSEGSLIKITATRDEKEVTLSVLDRGPGIPPEDIDKVFDKFFRSNSTSAISGTGLGLSICRAIVEAHGGRIWAEAREDGGTAMRFTLPVADEPMKIPMEVDQGHA